MDKSLMSKPSTILELKAKSLRKKEECAGKKNLTNIPEISVEDYSGRLNNIGGKLRGPIPTSARAKRDKIMQRMHDDN